MLEIKNVTKKYGKKVAVDNISLEVKAGEVFGFLGPNGAGKTTTINMIVGIHKKDEGKILIDGIDTDLEPIQAKKVISFVPDNPDIYRSMTGMEYTNFLADVYDVGLEERKERTMKYAEAFGLTDNLNDKISSYSHGMQQKIALIGALVSDPKLLILDEPMVGLDPKSAFKLKEIMRERCQEGKTVFFSTHVMEVAEKICDRIAIINHGKIVATGTIDEIKAMTGESGSLEELFLELTE